MPLAVSVFYLCLLSLEPLLFTISELLGVTLGFIFYYCGFYLFVHLCVSFPLSIPSSIIVMPSSVLFYLEPCRGVLLKLPSCRRTLSHYMHHPRSAYSCFAMWYPMISYCFRSSIILLTFQPYILSCPLSSSP